MDAKIRRALGPAIAWFKVEGRTLRKEHSRQEKRGRPGRNTRYRKIVEGRFALNWRVDAEKGGVEARTDGIFPRITDDRKLTPQKLLLAYKRQPQLEPRLDGLKNAHDAAFQYLKQIWQIEGLLCGCFPALLERQLRRGPKRARLKELPLYPEGRECTHPTTERAVELFDEPQVHRLYGGRDVEEVYPFQLSRFHRKLAEALRRARHRLPAYPVVLWTAAHS